MPVAIFVTLQFIKIDCVCDASITSSLDLLSLCNEVAALFFSIGITLVAVLTSLRVAFSLRLQGIMRQGKQPPRTVMRGSGCCNVRVGRFSDSFFHSTSLLWNSPPICVFLSSYHIPLFKRQVSPHLRVPRFCYFICRQYVIIY